MSEIGIQLDGTAESWRQRPAAMRRPVSRRPRVNEEWSIRKHTFMREGYTGNRLSKWKNEQLVTTGCDEPQTSPKISFEEGMVPYETEIGSLQNNQLTKNGEIRKPRHKRKGIKSSKKIPRQESQKQSPVKDEAHKSTKPTSNENANTSKTTAATEKDESMAVHNSRPTVQNHPHLRGRAMSYDDVYRQRSSSVQYTSPYYPISPNRTADSVEDVGSQIINNYSGHLEYNENIPKSTKRKSVRKFFRRLAGSLESLIKIGRKSKHRHSFHSNTNNDQQKSYNNPLFANYSPYISVDECVPSTANDTNTAQLVSATEKNDTPQEFLREETNKFEHGDRPVTTAAVERADSKRIAFSRGKRVYRSPSVQTEDSQRVRRNPMPPNAAGRRRKRRQLPSSRTKLRGFAIVGNGKIDDDWETRSETDSESCMFRSNNLRLADINFTVSSQSLGETKPIEHSNPGSQEGSNINGSNTQVKRKSKENLLPTKSKIADFFPKTVSNDSENTAPKTAQNNGQQNLRRHSNNLGPMKAVHPDLTDVPDTISRAASVGKFDVAPSRNVSRKRVRRRNSSFLPGNQKEKIEIETNLQQAASFEQIMGSLQEIVDNLGRVHGHKSSNEMLQKSTSSDDKIDGTPIHSNHKNPQSAQPSDDGKRVQNRVRKRKSVRRHESWVGAVSNRLDQLIDSGSNKNVDNIGNPPPKPQVKQEGTTHTSNSTDLKQCISEFRPHIENTTQSFIKREKVSFEELELDFRNFAREIRQRERQSIENMTTVGQ